MFVRWHSRSSRTSDISTLDGKFWEFTADMAKGDTAYTNIALGAHTDNTYFVRRPVTDLVARLSDALDALDRSLRTATLPPPLTHRWIRRRNASSRWILRRVDLERPLPRRLLPPLHHPGSSARGRRRNCDLPALAQIWVPDLEPRSCGDGVVSSEVE